MTIVRVPEVSRRFGEWLDRACSGEKGVITRLGQVVASRVPYRPLNPGLPNRVTRTSALVGRIWQRRAKGSFGDRVSIKAMVDEGPR